MNTSIYNYSFIIPHKNSPQLLQRCLNSIPSRKDIQIIVVDDNSSPEILNSTEFLQIKGSDSNSSIEIIYTKEGKGAGYARNVGLRHATGKWLLFADADDFYVKDFINILDKKVGTNHDVIYFDIFDFDNKEYRNNKKLYELICNYTPTQPNTVNEIKYGFWNPWNKMFSSTFIRKYHIEFDEIPVGNDAFFSLKAGENAHSIDVIKEKLYCYVYNPDGITERKRDFDREIHFLLINFRINKFLRKHNLFLKQNILFRPFILRSIYNRFGYKKLISYLFHFIKKDSLLLNIYYYYYFKYHNILS